MRKFLIILSIATLSTTFFSCKDASGDYPGDAYAPDMYYSRAYETYGYNSVDSYDSLRERTVSFRYNAMPVPGTIARGQAYNYHLSADSAGMQAAETLVSPFDTAAATPAMLSEGERLYLINCGICHGSKLDGQGPIFTNGSYPAAPKNLVSADAKAWTDGHYYHVITFGKGVMGSYASQLHPEQRWWIIEYIRSKQPAAGAEAAAAKATTDTTATAKK